MESFDNIPEKEKRGFFKVLDIFALKYSKLVGVNLLYTICSLPVIAVYMLLTSMVTGTLLPRGMQEIEIGTTILGAMLAIYLLVMLGGGPLAPGFIYVIRNFVRREHAFVFSDFFEHIKKNLKQSIPIFIIDIVVIGILFFNINATLAAPDIFYGYRVPFAFVMLLVFLIYFGARMYLYPLMVTFKASLSALIKTSFMLCILKLPQNIFFVLLSTGIYYLCSLIPFPLFALFIVPLAMVSFIEVFRMVYVYGVIEKNISMDSDNEEEKNDENK